MPHRISSIQAGPRFEVVSDHTGRLRLLASEGGLTCAVFTGPDAERTVARVVACMNACHTLTTDELIAMTANDFVAQ